MKKLIALLLVLCLSLGLVTACTPSGNPGDNENPGNDDTPGGNEDAGNEEEEEPPVEITYVQTYPYTDDDGILHIRYQDTYTFDTAVLSIEEQVVSSTVCGSERPDEAVLVMANDGAVQAVGCGSATVTLAGGEVKVMVDPSPINLLFVTGQSNASADWSFHLNTPEGDQYGPTYSQYFIRTAPTMAYFTWTGQWLSIEKKSTNHVAAECVPETLHWETLTNRIYAGGCNPTVFSQENTTFGQAGWCAALAHEWVEQTGERVWIVNASHGGMPIATFLPSEDGVPVDNDYYQATSVFNQALETIYREVDAGHFTLNHMAYYWFQGESDSARDDAYYLAQFAKMHAGFQSDVVYRHNGVEKKLEYCGIMTLRSCYDNEGNSKAELYMTGPRLSQYYMGGEREGLFSNVFIASNVTEKWVGGDENVEKYFLDTYGSPEAFYEIFGYDMPKTMYELHPNIHYLMKGHNEMGMDAARNSLRIINKTQPDKNYRLSYGEEEKLTVTLLTADGVTAWGDIILLDEENSSCIMYPAVSPTYAICRGVELRSETEGFTFEGYRLKPTGEQIPSSVTVALYVGGKKHTTYTMRVAQASSFMQNFPRYEMHPDYTYTFFGYTEPWRCGYVNYRTGAFTAFNALDQYGWLYNGIAMWGNAGNGGFWLGNGMKAGLQDGQKHCVAIEYTAQASGQLGVMADVFSPNTHDVYLAIAVNGEMVWPAVGGTLLNRVGDWYRADKNADDTATLNALWQDLSFSVSEGDSVTFLLAYADGVGQTLLYPSVYYTEKES